MASPGRRLISEKNMGIWIQRPGQTRFKKIEEMMLAPFLH